jgi:hypothetical protein
MNHEACWQENTADSCLNGARFRLTRSAEPPTHSASLASAADG